MKPDWDKLMAEYKDSTSAAVIDVDCTAAGKLYHDGMDDPASWSDGNKTHPTGAMSHFPLFEKYVLLPNNFRWKSLSDE